MKQSAMLLADFYKLSHREQYPKGTEIVYSTWTPRTSRISNIKNIVVFGQQYFIKKYLIDFFNENFFSRSLVEVVEEYSRVVKYTLGVERPSTTHIEELHNLGYLPILIKSLPEGMSVPLRTPMMTIENTNPKFFWLTNYIETIASCELWKPSTSATIAKKYKELLSVAAIDSVGDSSFVQFQGHDFSMRGMSCLESAMTSGAGHLLSFVGTDTIPAIAFLEKYYNANIEKELVGTSIPATEHSVQCSYGNDMEYFKRTITEVYPSGFASVVSDGYDFWKVIGELLPELRETILARDGKVVIRPDSGDPVKIICGDSNGTTDLERKGAVESLWDIFGGTMSKEGYKVLDSHIGLIYGDAITYDRCYEICHSLMEKGFASTNVVYGIGSYTYQYNTRDTFGFALKSTSCTINGEEKQIFKDPKTDDGTKKSLKGRVAIVDRNGTLATLDELSTLDIIQDNLLRPIFENGQLLVDDTLQNIRERCNVNI